MVYRASLTERRRHGQESVALAAAQQASQALASLIDFSRADSLFIEHDTIAALVDAAKLAIECVEDPDEGTNQLLGALERYLEGWVG